MIDLPVFLFIAVSSIPEPCQSIPIRSSLHDVFIKSFTEKVSPVEIT